MLQISVQTMHDRPDCFVDKTKNDLCMLKENTPSKKVKIYLRLL